MGLPSAGSKIFQPTPPDKGSFPLDHEGECKPFMTAFMNCMKSNQHDSRLCREQSALYLRCRMDKELMSKEDMENLGFKTH